jgi:ABC-type antimicrobial peptide transport system permease subunit
MNYIFDPNIYFDFDLELNFSIIIRILLVTIILNFLSVLYPLYKISKLDIIESIKNRA